MQHHEAVVVVVMVGDAVGEVCPEGRRHVAGVDGRIELEGVDLDIELFQLRHVLQQLFEIEGFEGTRLGIAVHTDGATCIDKQYLGSHRTNVYVVIFVQR